MSHCGRCIAKIKENKTKKHLVEYREQMLLTRQNLKYVV